MANWLVFEQVKAWDAAVLPLFQYDGVTDEAIAAALSDEANLSHVNPSIDWEDDHWLQACTTIPVEHKHAYRVAALVRAFQAGSSMSRPIYLDTFLLGQCGCGVGDGHHRIRALQFLGVPAGPFALSGYTTLLNELVRTAGCAVPQEHAKYFASRFLAPEDDDVDAGDEGPAAGNAAV